jgi:alkylation response protein AidB-like acyl-CoA dehydrogenase
MDFNYSDEQQMLADTLARFVADAYPLEARRKLAASELGFSSEYWQQFADLGLLGLNIPEQHGGLGGTPADTLIVMQAFGRGLVLEPYLSTAVLGAALISASGSQQQQSNWLPAIAAGSKRLALATLEPESRFDLWHIATRAEQIADHYVLNGRKSVVLHGDSADALIVSARTSAGEGDCDGITLFLVDANAAGVGIQGFPNIDGQRSAEVTLHNVVVQADAIIGAVDAGYEPLELTVDTGVAALCAEAVGCMEKLLEITAEYLRARTQFGRAIATFQSLQHRVADMAIAIEQARSAAYLAAARVHDPDTLQRRRAVSAAKALVGRSGRYVGQQAVQLHGGMGMTDELAVGHYFKRLTCIDMTWGNTEHHTERYGETF